MFLVGGFSGNPLVRAAARASFDGHGCRVIDVLRPDVAIITGAVLFADNVEVFTTRKVRLTYGVRTLGLHDGSDPEHVSRREKYPYFDQDHQEQIPMFSGHLKAGDDVPLGHICPKQRYCPILQTQDAVTMTILASHKKDIRFPDEGNYFPMGEVTVPLDITLSYDDRGVDVEFVFGGSEFSVHCSAAATGANVGNIQVGVYAGGCKILLDVVQFVIMSVHAALLNGASFHAGAELGLDVGHVIVSCYSVMMQQILIQVCIHGERRGLASPFDLAGGRKKNIESSSPRPKGHWWVNSKGDGDVKGSVIKDREIM